MSNGDTGAQSAVEYAQSVCDRRRDLRDRTGNLKLWGYARTGKRHCSELVFPDPDFVSVILTGLNIYPKLAKFGGAGTLVPITGFANSVAASAIEYQKEGQVFGIGCKIFTIAGPVILYGIFSSWVLGLIYWIFQVTVYQM